MNIYFSTNAVRAEEFYRIHEYLDPFQGKIGVELFPEFHKEGFDMALQKEKEYLKTLPFSCHGPYYESEYSVEQNTRIYQHSIDLLEKTLEQVKELKPSHMVFHHSNCEILPQERESRLKCARTNYYDIKTRCEDAGIKMVVENVTLVNLNKALFSEQEFIDECKRIDCNVLIDIGHANASNWNLTHVMEELQDQIVAYHVHNNSGVIDDHRRIHDGTLDFEKFIDDYKRFTPNADIVVEYCPEAAQDVEGVKEDFQYLLQALQ